MPAPRKGGSEGAAREPAAPTGLMNRDFLLFWQGQLVSLLGSQAFSLALLYWAMETTGSASLMGAVGAASLLPAILLMPLGGALADRFPRRRVLIACDLVSGLSSLALAGLFFALGRGSPALAVAVVAAATLDKVVLSFFVPAFGAALPELVPPARLPAANALTQVSHQASSVAGRATAGALYAWLGAPALFLIDALTFLYAAASTAVVHLPPPAPPLLHPASPRQPKIALTGDIRGAFRFLRSRPGQVELLLVVALSAALFQPVLVLLPFYAANCLGRGAEWYGFLLAAHGLGSVAGLGAAALAGRIHRVDRRSAAALAAGGCFVGTLGLARQPWIALALSAGAGASFAMLSVALQSFFQLATPAELRGRVLALLQTVAMGAAALGAALGGVAGDATGKDIPLIFGFCGGTSVLVALRLLTRGASEHGAFAPSPPG